MKIKSEHIQVYPTAFRDKVGTSNYNPESRLNTEFNLTNRFRLLGNDNYAAVGSKSGSFVVSWNSTSKVLIFLIHGYYFKATLSASDYSDLFSDPSNGDTIWGQIQVLPFTNDEGSNTKYKAFTLVSTDASGSTTTGAPLDNISGDVAKFGGVAITRGTQPMAASTKYTLALLEYNSTSSKWEIPEKSKLILPSSAVKNTDGSPIHRKFTTDELNVAGVTLKAGQYQEYPLEISGGTLVGGDFDVIGDLTINGSGEVSRDLQVRGGLDAQVATIGDNLTVDGDGYVRGGLQVGQNLTVDGHIDAGSILAADEITTDGRIEAGSIAATGPITTEDEIEAGSITAEGLIEAGSISTPGNLEAGSIISDANCLARGNFVLMPGNNNNNKIKAPSTAAEREFTLPELPEEYDPDTGAPISPRTGTFAMVGDFQNHNIYLGYDLIKSWKGNEVGDAYIPKVNYVKINGEAFSVPYSSTNNTLDLNQKINVYSELIGSTHSKYVTYDTTLSELYSKLSEQEKNSGAANIPNSTVPFVVVIRDTASTTIAAATPRVFLCRFGLSKTVSASGNRSPAFIFSELLFNTISSGHESMDVYSVDYDGSQVTGSKIGLILIGKKYNPGIPVPRVFTANPFDGSWSYVDKINEVYGNYLIDTGPFDGFVDMGSSSGSGATFEFVLVIRRNGVGQSWYNPHPAMSHIIPLGTFSVPPSHVLPDTIYGSGENGRLKCYGAYIPEFGGTGCDVTFGIEYQYSGSISGSGTGLVLYAHTPSSQSAAPVGSPETVNLTNLIDTSNSHIDANKPYILYFRKLGKPVYW